MAIDPALIQAEILRRMLDVRLCREVPIANPAVGAEFSSGPASGFTWDLLSARYTLTTSAAAGTRLPDLALVNADGTRIWRLIPTTGMLGTAVNEFTWVVGLGYTGSPTPIEQGLPVPAAIVHSGMTVRSSTVGLDAGDQFSAILLYVREYSAAQIAAMAGEISEEFSSEVIGGLVE